MDDLGGKSAASLRGAAQEALRDSSDAERCCAADETIVIPARSTDLVSPGSRAGRAFRDAVLALSRGPDVARFFVDPGWLSGPRIRDGFPLEAPDALAGARYGEGFRLDRLGDGPA